MQSISHQQAQELLHKRKCDLSEDQTEILDAHLASCTECSQYAASLEHMHEQIHAAFHTRWDHLQPSKSPTGGMLIKMGREITKIRISTIAGTVVGLLALIALVLGLDYILSSLRPQPATLPGKPTETLVTQPTSQPIFQPTLAATTPDDTLALLATPLPEGSIVLNWGHAIVPPDPVNNSEDSWPQKLSAASGLNIVPLPGPTTDMEVLQAMRDGSIHMAILDPLAYGYGLAQGWIVPGPVMTFTYQPTGEVMFVSRNDTGLVAGESDQMYQQLAGKRPCWPNLDSMNWPPVYEYIIPAGLLTQQGIELGEPAYIGDPKQQGMVLVKSVFLKECDFAAFEAEPVEGFKSLWFPELGGQGYTFQDLSSSMQVLFYTQPLVPYKIMAFSVQLDPAQVEQLTQAMLDIPSFDSDTDGVFGWLPYDAEQAAYYDRFQGLVDASGVDVADYLSRVWDQYLQGLIAAAQTPSPAVTPTTSASGKTLTICQGAEPDTLYVYAGTMLAAKNVLEAIYDGPIDTVGFSYQPVILEKLPSLADGDATIQPVAVNENDYVVNDAGEAVQLKPGEVVRPYGCNLSECAITWQGEPLEMAQMSATFTLKEGIRWSDGEPLTAYDSVFGYEKATECEDLMSSNIACGTLGTGGSQTVNRTASYTALDDRTAQWVGLPGYLDQAFMTNFAHPLPEHQLSGMTSDELFDADESALRPMGWGPYAIDTWKQGEYIRLVKNPYYFRADEGLPYFDELIIRFYGQDEEATLSALQNGECDLVDYEQALKHTSLERLIEADKNGQIQAFITTGTTWEHLDFNLRPPQTSLNNGSLGSSDLDGDGQGPFGDVRLRQAIAMCLDRQKLVDELFFGSSSVPDTYLPSNHPLFNPQAIRWTYDPEAAGKLLDEIGWLDIDDDPQTVRLSYGVTGVPDDTPLVLVYDTTEAAIRQQVFQILADSLGSCGIQAYLLTYPADQFFRADPEGIVYGRLFSLAEFAWLTGVVPPCDLFLSTNIPTLENNWSGNNTVGYISPEYDLACNLQFQSLPGGSDYMQGVMEAQRIFSEQLPVVPLFMQVKYAASRSDLCGFSVDPTAHSDFWNIELFNIGDGCR